MSIFQKISPSSAKQDYALSKAKGLLHDNKKKTLADPVYYRKCFNPQRTNASKHICRTRKKRKKKGRKNQD